MNGSSKTQKALKKADSDMNKVLKLLSLLFIWCIVVVTCCSCGLLRSRRGYECNLDDVESIQIIRFDKYVEEEYRYDYTVLATITDLADFVNRLNNIDYKGKLLIGDPLVFDVGYIVVKIDYRNGDYDYLCSDVQMFNRSGTFRDGSVYFDEEQFSALISDYLSE